MPHLPYTESKKVHLYIRTLGCKAECYLGYLQSGDPVTILAWHQMQLRLTWIDSDKSEAQALLSLCFCLRSMLL